MKPHPEPVEGWRWMLKSVTKKGMNYFHPFFALKLLGSVITPLLLNFHATR